MVSLAPTAVLDCPDADSIVDFARGALSPALALPIEQHLDHCSVCATLVGEVAGLSLGGLPQLEDGHTVTTGPRVGAEPMPEPGTTIGRYIVLSPLGSGGMGTVYAAHDRELDREIALKLIRTEIDEDPARRADVQARLLREARAMARLHHPNVVPVHDVGMFAGRPFMAMERIKGGTLATWLAAEARPWRRIRDVFEHAGQALFAAHEAGLVHRDFKPSNVLVDPHERVFVADFGLAREQGASLAHDPAGHARPSARLPEITEDGSVVGTLAYMAPEQLEGRPVDGRADQFSFCVVLHAALHGQLPPVTRNRDHVAGASRGFKGASDAVPPWLDGVLARGSSADPEHRFPTMSALLEAMGHDRKRARTLRNLGWVLALVGPLLVALAWWGLRPGPTAEQLARLEQLEQQAQQQAAAGRYIYPPPDEPSQPTAYSSVMTMEAMDAEIDELAEARAHALRDELATELVSEADRLWERPGGRVFAIDAYAAALVFDPAQPRARERAGLTTGELVQLRQQAQTLAFTPAELEAAAALARVREVEEPTVELWEELAARERPLVFAAGLAELLGAANAGAGPAAKADPQATEPHDGSSAVDAGTMGASERPSPGRPSGSSARDPAAAKPLIERAREALSSARLDDAERAFVQALAADPRAAAAHAGLAEVEFERSAYARAITHAERAVTLAPKRAQYRVLLGDALLKVHRYDEAREHYRRAASLGSSTAQHRAELLDEKLGGSR